MCTTTLPIQALSYYEFPKILERRDRISSCHAQQTAVAEMQSYQSLKGLQLYLS